MPTAPPLFRAHPDASPDKRRRTLVYIVGAVVLAGIVLAFVAMSGGPKFISRVTVVNPTAYDLDVDIASGAGDGWTGLGTVERTGDETFQDVVDQGDTWIFRFSYGGKTAGEVRMTSQDLSRARWRVEVPPTFADTLRAAGVSPPA